MTNERTSQVPYEQFRKAFRSTQRGFERDFTQLTSSAADISRSGAEGDGISAQQSPAVALDAMIARVETFRKRVSTVIDESSLVAAC
jgi:hypothetical protein